MLLPTGSPNPMVLQFSKGAQGNVSYSILGLVMGGSKPTVLYSPYDCANKVVAWKHLDEGGQHLRQLAIQQCPQPYLH